MKYRYSRRFFTYPPERGRAPPRPISGERPPPRRGGGADPGRRHRQAGSLAGAAHLLDHNAGVLRGAHGEQKSPAEQKGKSPLDFDFQCEYKPRKRGLSILWRPGVWGQRCQKSYHRDNWLVAAKRS